MLSQDKITKYGSKRSILFNCFFVFCFSSIYFFKFIYSTQWGKKKKKWPDLRWKKKTWHSARRRIFMQIGDQTSQSNNIVIPDKYNLCESTVKQV